MQPTQRMKGAQREVCNQRIVLVQSPVHLSPGGSMNKLVGESRTTLLLHLHDDRCAFS
jgi:hypothetical protein